MASLAVVHDIPGRLRVRLPHAGGDAAGAVAREPGVTQATWSPRTRSLLILYDPDVADRAALVRVVAHEAGLDEPGPAHPAPIEGDALARGVTAMFAEIDGGVRRATRGMIGLGGVVPLALIGWAVREAALGRGAPLAWSSALWYAHGLFRDYSVPPTSPAPPG